MHSTSFFEETMKEFVKSGTSTCLQKPTDINKLPEQILDAVTKSTKISRYW